ncbi:MAG: branched-chain amino acid ABC transporter permease, partial [Desulfobacterales bacterium]|nr:branched-chain amino acid ABC transporter permease [Desulfobacterales bacterium]
SISRSTGGNLLLSAIGAAIVVGLIGAGVERLLLRRLYRQHLEQVLVSFGLIYIFMDICKFIWGMDDHAISKPVSLAGSVSILGSSYPAYRLAVIVIGIAVAAGLWLFQEKTRWGAVIRAGVDDKEMVTGLGINIGVTSTLVFALGAFLAGFGGVVGGPFIGVSPGFDVEILILALIVVVVGGLGPLQGALAGSLLIGILDSFGKALFPGLAMFTVYAIMVVILILRPSGLLGRR